MQSDPEKEYYQPGRLSLIRVLTSLRKSFWDTLLYLICYGRNPAHPGYYPDGRPKNYYVGYYTWLKYRESLFGKY